MKVLSVNYKHPLNCIGRRVSKPTNLKQTILKKLTSREPIHKDDLFYYLNFVGFDISERYMRRVINEMKKKDGHVICSSNKGYKLASNRKEFEAHIRYKKSYAFSILADCKQMLKNFNRQLKPQLW